MTQLEQIKTEIWRLIKVNKSLKPRDFTQGIAVGYADVLSFIESLEKEELQDIKIKGWVARDKDDSLWFHYSKPHLENEIEKTWWGSSDDSFEIYDFNHSGFEDVTFDDGPIEVELTIHRV